MPELKRTSLKDIRKDEIIQAALAVLSERGSANITLDDIAKASGFSKGGITYYYSSKEALIMDVFEHFYSYVYKRSYEEIAKHKNPLDKILSFIWIFDMNDYQAKTMYPLLLDIMVLAAYNNEYRATFQGMVNAWVKMGIEILEEGNAIGQFKVDDVTGTAQLISATGQGMAVRWYLDQENHTSEWAVKAWKRAVYCYFNVQFDQVPEK